MTDIPHHHDRLAEAVRTGDIETALDAQRAIATSSPPLPELLDEFRAAVDAGDDARAETVLTKIDDRIEERRPAEQASVEQAALTREENDPDRETLTELQTHIENATETSLDRAGFLGVATTYLEDGWDDTSEVTEAADTLGSKERELQSSVERVEETLDSTTLPASVEVVAIGNATARRQVDEEFAVTATVENLGDRRATDVTVRVEPGDGLAASPGERGPIAVEPGQRREVEFTVVGTRSGEFTLGFRVDSENAGVSSGETTVIVRSEADPPATPVEALAGTDGEVTFDDVITAISLYNQDEPVPETDGMTLDFGDVVGVIAAYNERET
ncbi:CARDB domain-containing protein [Halostella salina]|uniref:CARDB domain-containing protein n=1 Tax=Halostella salina TaxID=1547897 RepID=UPI000EF8270F|nr:CARDB domain-containing protein [Halostella salina]